MNVEKKDAIMNRERLEWQKKVDASFNISESFDGFANLFRHGEMGFLLANLFVFVRFAIVGVFAPTFALCLTAILSVALSLGLLYRKSGYWVLTVILFAAAVLLDSVGTALFLVFSQSVGLVDYLLVGGKALYLLLAAIFFFLRLRIVFSRNLTKLKSPVFSGILAGSIALCSIGLSAASYSKWERGFDFDRSSGRITSLRSSPLSTCIIPSTYQGGVRVESIDDNLFVNSNVKTVVIEDPSLNYGKALSSSSLTSIVFNGPFTDEALEQLLNAEISENADICLGKENYLEVSSYLNRNQSYANYHKLRINTNSPCLYFDTYGLKDDFEPIILEQAGGYELPTPASYTNENGRKMLFRDWRSAGGITFEAGQHFSEKQLIITPTFVPEYNISYNLNDGELIGECAAFSALDKEIILPTAKKGGHYFAGWRVSNGSSLSGIQRDDIACVSSLSPERREDLSLDAYFVRVYQLALNPAGGEIEGSMPSSYHSEREVPLPSPTKNGYLFKGWADSKGATINSIPQNTAGDLSLTAKWEAIVYSISYDYMGGSLCEGESETKSYTIEDHVALPNVERRGYDFKGWSSSDGRINNVTFIQTGTTGDLSLCAGWSAIIYSIHLDPREGDLSTETLTYTVEDTLILPTPTRHGYDFLGWSSVGGTYNRVFKIEKGTIGNIDLFAEYSPTTYSIAYDYAGGTRANGQAETKSYTIEVFVSLPNAEKRGYTFKGWSSSDNRFKNATSIPVGTTGDIVLTAQWSIVTYTISLDPGEGDLSTTALTYTVEDLVNLPTPTRLGYDFLGWSSVDGTYNRVFKIEKGTIGNTDLFAEYSPTLYSISYDYSGGSLTAGQAEIKSYTIESSVSLPNAERKGYEFNGWNSSDGRLKNAASVPVGTTGDIVLTAQWSIVTYTISLDPGEGDLSTTALTYTVEDLVNLPTPTRLGYDFLGWSSANGVYSKIAQIKVGTVGDIELFAEYSVQA